MNAFRRDDARRWAEQRAALDQIKLERGCVDCGYAEHPAALHFDHVRGEKKFRLSHGRHLAWHRVLAEIQKCDVVCANCHAIRTAERGYSGGRNRDGSWNKGGDHPVVRDADPTLFQ